MCQKPTKGFLLDGDMFHKCALCLGVQIEKGVCVNEDLSCSDGVHCVHLYRVSLSPLAQGVLHQQPMHILLLTSPRLSADGISRLFCTTHMSRFLSSVRGLSKWSFISTAISFCYVLTMWIVLDESVGLGWLPASVAHTRSSVKLDWAEHGGAWAWAWAWAWA